MTNLSVLPVPARVALDYVRGGLHHTCSRTKEFLESVGIKRIECPNGWNLPVGFVKVDEDNPCSYQFCGCFNPTTMEYFTVLEWDYEDCRVDANDYRTISIDPNTEAFAIWFNLVYYKSYLKAEELKKEEAARQALIPAVGDKARVVKGRTLPKGTEGVVTKIFNWRNPWGAGSCRYAILDGDKKINIDNLVKI